MNRSALIARKCCVPSCGNSTTKTRDKIFISVRNAIKERWCRKLKIPFNPKRRMWCCEDHLDLKKDLENYTFWKLMNGTPKLKLDAELRNLPLPSTSKEAVTTNVLQEDIENYYQWKFCKSSPRLKSTAVLRNAPEIESKQDDCVEISSEEESNQDESNQDQSKQDKSKQDESKQDESKRDDNEKMENEIVGSNELRSLLLKSPAKKGPSLLKHNSPSCSSTFSGPVLIDFDYPEDHPDVPSSGTCMDEDQRHLKECTFCQKKITGFRYICVQCNKVILCPQCEMQGKHLYHYVLRVPFNKKHEEIKAVLERVRRAINNALIDSVGNYDYASTSMVAKDEPVTKRKKPDPHLLCLKPAKTLSRWSTDDSDTDSSTESEEKSEEIGIETDTDTTDEEITKEIQFEEKYIETDARHTTVKEIIKEVKYEETDIGRSTHTDIQGTIEFKEIDVGKSADTDIQGTVIEFEEIEAEKETDTEFDSKIEEVKVEDIEIEESNMFDDKFEEIDVLNEKKQDNDITIEAVEENEGDRNSPGIMEYSFLRMDLFEVWCSTKGESEIKLRNVLNEMRTLLGANNYIDSTNFDEKIRSLCDSIEERWIASDKCKSEFLRKCSDWLNVVENVELRVEKSLVGGSENKSRSLRKRKLQPNYAE